MVGKNDIINFIKFDRSLLTARNLYNKVNGKNLATQSYLSKLSKTPENLRVACYELCKCVGIPERQMKALLSYPVKSKCFLNESKVDNNLKNYDDLILRFDQSNFQDKDLSELVNHLKISFQVPRFQKGIKGLKERKDFTNKYKIEVNGTKIVDFDEAILKHKTNYFISEIVKRKEFLLAVQLKEMSDKTKNSIKLREQFPFLKDDDCPRELKLLVSDLITAYDNLIENQPQLHKNLTQEKLSQIANSVKDNFIIRKEVFAELEFYKNNESLLGKHPLFARLKQEDEIKRMNADELSKKKANLINNINRNKKKLKEAKSDKTVAKYKDLLITQVNLKKLVESELKNR